MILKILILLYVCVWVPLKLKLQSSVSHHVGAENSNSKPLKEQLVPLNLSHLASCIIILSF